VFLATLPKIAAAEVSVAIVDISFGGDLVTEAIDPVSHALERGISTSGTTVVMPDVVAETLRQAGLDTRCVRGQCLGEVGALTNVEALLRADVVQEGQHYTIRLELLLGRDGSRLGAVESTCDVCNWDEAVNSILAGATALRTSMPGVLAVTATPVEAAVTVDGVPIARSGQLAVAPGRHEIRATAPGYREEIRRVAIGPGQATSLALELTSASRRSRAQPLQIAGWVSGGLALATLIPGVVWLTMDGDCPAGTANSAGLCPEVYDTWREGVALTVISGALVVTSVVLFIVSARRNRRARGPAVAAAIVPLERGGALSLAASF
jgi:hypothetical protein